MKTNIRVLMSIPTRSHVEIAEDELEGLRELGYACSSFSYSAKENISSGIGRLWVLLVHAVSLVIKAYAFKPDVIYFNSRLEVLGSTRDFISILIVKLFYLRKVNFMIKSHGSDIEVLSSTSFLMNKIVLPFLKGNVAAWLLLSSEEKERVIGLGYFSSTNIFLTKNIVRTHQFHKDPKFKISHRITEKETILLFTGRFIREKGIYEVIEAFEKLVPRYQLKLILIGDGSEHDKVVDWVKLRKLDQYVIFTGFIPEKSVITYYANCDILVFPTYAPEGFPMALFNAVGAGMNVVTTQIRAAKDYLIEPENCLWVTAQDSASVKNAIISLLESPSLRASMSQQNIARGVLYSRKVVCEELSAIIKQILTPYA